MLSGMSRHYLLEVAQVAVLSDQHKSFFAFCHSEEGVDVAYDVRAIESFELVRFLYCFLEPVLIRVYLRNEGFVI